MPHSIRPIALLTLMSLCHSTMVATHENPEETQPQKAVTHKVVQDQPQKQKYINWRQLVQKLNHEPINIISFASLTWGEVCLCLLVLWIPFASHYMYCRFKNGKEIKIGKLRGSLAFGFWDYFWEVIFRNSVYNILTLSLYTCFGYQDEYNNTWFEKHIVWCVEDTV